MIWHSQKFDGWFYVLVRLQISDTTEKNVKAFFFGFFLPSNNEWKLLVEQGIDKKGAVSKHSHKPGGGEDKIDTFISAAAASHRHILGVCASRNG